MAATAKAQTQQPIDVVCVYLKTEFYSWDNDLFIILRNDEYAFTFDIICEQGSQDLVDGQTYTLSDMLAFGTYGQAMATGEEITYSSASVVRNNGSYVADVTDINGNQYHITYTPAEPITVFNDTVDVLMDNARVNRLTDYTASQSLFVMIGADASSQYSLQLAINTDNIAGTYSSEDVNYNSTFFTVGGVIRFVNTIHGFTVTGDATSCSTYVEVVTSDSILYRINYSFPGVVPDPTDTVDITMDNAEINAVYDKTGTSGTFLLVGADKNDEYRMNLEVHSVQIAGSYTMGDVRVFTSKLTHNTATDTTAVEMMEIRAFTVVGDTASCSTYIEILSEDLVLYKITYTYGNAPEPPVSVENVNEPEFVVVSENNAIVVYTTEGQDVMVCDMAGRILMDGKTASDVERINVAVPGVYVVRIGNRTVNVLVK